ncbi:MAG: PDDEXK nuclease domain-containing protein [Desulfovibrio sp.]|jgi:predicted nuclease of restriction endonuclease-like (RecB) superfamily|nr:PDDEXK nuclease domain-containing protein [Desulfovibrio sp.]
MKMDNKFFDKVASLIEQSRGLVGRTADLTMCVTYYEIGRMIVEQEQDGKARAEYGSGLLKELSAYLARRVGRGFSETNLRNARKFYQVYSPSIQLLLPNVSADTSSASIQQKSSAELRQMRATLIQQILSAESNPFRLGWSHYQILMRIKNVDERRFYEIEAINEQWTQEQLKRQYNSSLYERLALSRDKDEVMRLAREGQTMEKPHDMLKNPLVLEFYGLEQMPSYSESDLESAINDNLQKFLLELGKGFLFEARQKRFAFDEKSFFVDLVFYNRLLQCYVLIDLKTGELHHQDLGQMLMYVNYFDRYVKKDFEKPTVGILLCQEKNDSIVELTLPEDTNIYASEYSLYLPDKELLQQKLAEWTQEFEKAQEAWEAVRDDGEA